MALIAVCIPTRGIVVTEVMQGVVENMAGRDWRLFTTTDEGLPECMNRLVEQALGAEADWIWVVEEDTVPPAGILDQMLAANVDYIATDYPVGNGHSCFGFDPNDCTEPLWTGLGCTLIRASAFGKIPRPWFECNRNMVVVHKHGMDYFTADGRTVNHRGGHDLSFCEKLKKAGVKIHGIEGIECRHLKVVEWNTAPTNKACQTVKAVPEIVVKWSEYLEQPATVSVVIPCYNYAQYLGEAIESALTQTVKPLEVIVVDDGSTDDSAKVAGRYPVTLIRQENKGLPGARNTGFQAARGTYVVPLDADDVLHRDAVERLLKLRGRGPVRCSWVWNGIPQKLFPGTSLAAFLDKNRAAATQLIPKAVWAAVGGYDESMKDGFEDWDFNVRVVAAGYEMETTPECLFEYRRHGDSLVDNAVANRSEIMAYMRKKWAAMGIERPVVCRRVAPLHYPISIAVDCKLDGKRYPAGSRIDRETAVALKAAGQLKDERIL